MLCHASMPDGLEALLMSGPTPVLDAADVYRALVRIAHEIVERNKGASELVVVGTEPTVWDLARRLEPAASGPRLAELVERIAVDNALTSVELQPGQVLRVPPG